MPSTFLDVPGTPAESWTQWIKCFEKHLEAIDGTKYDPARKQAKMYNCLGVEGRRLFDHIAPVEKEEEEDQEWDVFTEDKARMKNYFDTTMSGIMERYNFHYRYQAPGESIESYVATLRMLATTYSFRDMDEMISHQVVMRTTCIKAQEKLLCYRNPCLEKVVSTIKSMERSAKEIKLLRKPDNHSADVNLIRKESESSTSQVRKSNKKSGSNSSSNKMTCYRCGSSTHLASSRECPAIGKTCKGCGKVGHFLKVCKSSHVKKVFKVEEYKTDEDSDDNEMMENLVLLVAIISKEDLHNQPKCNIHVNGESVEMLVDTGSRITILSKKTYETLGCKAPLQVSKIIPGACGGHKIKLEGVFNADLKFKDKSTSPKVFVVDYNVNILGWLEQQSLRMLINPCQPPYVFSIQKDSLENILDEYKEVCSGKLGFLKNFKHKIILKEDVQPVKQRVRNIPLSARSEVKAILKNWCDEGIIEPINASVWLLPVALAKKRNGSIRLCIDLRQLNNHVVADCQPLPLINEMVMTLDQAKFFTTLDFSAAYNQVQLEEGSKRYTAFITPEVAYQFCRLPFRLCSASSVFQRVMSQLFF
ncbi:hypothetical protein NDU88_011033 [Pleurodeles waltl]|uniref:ribonuclease H n=1 Tax=Pleurodeles waltl TaxID=8319 RepID=A0AAV7S2S9_PLEWA|nr:hypothetical protein NDU88_011033 [Pleurodeles waltl]